MSALELVEATPRWPTLPTGASAPPFGGLLGVDGAYYDSTSFADREAIVLVFSSNRCPTAKAYGARLNALQARYGPSGVQLIALNANDPHLYPDEDYARMIERAHEDGYTFPYVVDDGQRVAKAYGATCTFHVFVLDGQRHLRYEGRFDDSRIPERVTSHDLVNALDDLLAGQDVRVPTTRPFGCSLDLV